MDRSDSSSQWTSKIGFIAFCLAAFPLLGLLAFVDPSSGTLGAFELCPFHAATGLSCAGCGATRAAHELLHGHVMQALAYNPLTTILSPFATYLVACWGLHAFSGRILPLPKFKLPLALALIVATIAFSVIRNIPAEPFKKLAPHCLQTSTEGR